MIDLTAEEILSELVLLNTTITAAAFLIVEGEADRKLFQQIVTDNDCIYIYPAGTQSLVIDAIEELSSDPKLLNEILPTRGIIDRDYLVPLNKSPINPAILLSDLRDVECMMIDSGVFKAVTDEFVDWAKAGKSGIKNVADLRAVLISVCAPVGALRFWSQSSSRNITFRHLDLAKCLKFDRGNKVTLDINGLLTRLQGAQKGQTVSANDFANAQTLCSSENYFSSPLLLCRGHDLTVVLAAVLRKCIGNGGARAVCEDELERLLRIGFPKFWLAYGLFNDLKAWLAQTGLALKLA